MSISISFHTSIQELFPQLRSYAMFLTRDHADSLDLFQETCFKAYKNYKSFKPGTNLKNWSFAIMRNSYINSYRKNKKKQSIFSSDVSDHYIDANAIHESENAAPRTFVMNDLQDAIDSLSPTLRSSFVMHHEGYKYQDIADEFEVPLGTVKTRIHLARKKLQAVLQAKQYRIAS